MVEIRGVEGHPQHALHLCKSLAFIACVWGSERIAQHSILRELQQLQAEWASRLAVPQRLACEGARSTAMHPDHGRAYDEAQGRSSS